MPGHRGNLNAAKSGAQLSTRLNLGELPKAMARQLSSARKYRRNLEDCVMTAKGSVDTTDAHLIDEAANAEVHSHVCRWLLRTRLAKMETKDIIKCSEQILKAKTIRNRAVERLGLASAEKNILDALYHVQESPRIAQDCDPDPNTPEITPEIDDAGDAKSDAQNQEHDR